MPDTRVGLAADRRGRSTFRGMAIGSLLVAALLSSGCPQATQSPTPVNALPFEGQSLTLLVADDPDLAAAIGRLSGEWQARTGASFTVAECTAAELLSDAAPAADAVVYPAADLPELALGERLSPLPAATLDESQWNWQEVFPAIRVHEATWNHEVVAVPYGSPVLVCYYRADLFEKLGQRPPQTWQEYQALAEFFHDRANLSDFAPPAEQPWCGAIEPLAPGWAGVTLLARAASYAKHPYFHSTLFQIDTMQPRIDTPPFVRALEELVAASKFGPADPQQYGPTEAREAFWRGECAMAFAWPQGTRKRDPSGQSRPEFTAGFRELPGATELFDPDDQQWELLPAGQVRYVPLLSIAGRLGSVLRGTRHEAAAAQMLLTLASAEWTDRLAGAGSATTLFRAEQARSPRAWVEREADAAAAALFGGVIERALASEEILSAVRIPGRRQYLAALDEAVRQALAGEQSPVKALREAAKEWHDITAELGLEQQRRAYRLSLGQAP